MTTGKGEYLAGIFPVVLPLVIMEGGRQGEGELLVFDKELTFRLIKRAFIISSIFHTISS
jgi:hypothetical protein